MNRFKEIDLLIEVIEENLGGDEFNEVCFYLEEFKRLKLIKDKYEKDPVCLIRGRYYSKNKMEELRRVSKYCEKGEVEK